MVPLRVWAESCRYIEGDMSATCSWLDPESFNHSLPNILYELEGHARLAHEVDPGVWGHLPFIPREEPLENHVNGTFKTEKSHLPKGKAHPPAPVFPPDFVWPPTPAKDGRYLSTAMLFDFARERGEA